MGIYTGWRFEPPWNVTDQKPAWFLTDSRVKCHGLWLAESLKHHWFWLAYHPSCRGLWVTVGDTLSTIILPYCAKRNFIHANTLVSADNHLPKETQILPLLWNVFDINSIITHGCYHNIPYYRLRHLSPTSSHPDLQNSLIHWHAQHIPLWLSLFGRATMLWWLTHVDYYGMLHATVKGIWWIL